MRPGPIVVGSSILVAEGGRRRLIVEGTNLGADPKIVIGAVAHTPTTIAAERLELDVEDLIDELATTPTLRLFTSQGSADITAPTIS